MWQIERGDRDINFCGLVFLFEKQRCAATARESSNATCIRNFARLPGENAEILRGNGSPSDKRRTGGALTIDAMTIAQAIWDGGERVPRPAAKTSA